MDVLSTALSGLDAAEKRLAVSADNIANSNTVGAKAKEVTQTASADGGVIVDVRDKTPATQTVPSLDGGTEEVPNTSLDEEVANQISAKAEFEANLQVIKREKENTDKLLDIFA